MAKNCKNPLVTSLDNRYQHCYDKYLIPFSSIIESHIKDLLTDIPHIDRVSARAKTPRSFLTKAAKEEGGKPKYDDPMRQVQDQIGARIVVFYKSDIIQIDRIIKGFFTTQEHGDRVPESQWAFGYFGRHYVVRIPQDLRTLPDIDDMPRYFELQVKTLFQHAWSEASHDIAYKPGARDLSQDQERQLAFASAQAWGADRLFDELYLETADTPREQFSH